MNAARLKIAAITTAFVVVLAGVAAFLWVGMKEPQALAGKFGAPFTLLDDNGQPITEAALEGQPSLIYFGFTRCPEVCPTTLFEMSGWFKELGPEGKDLKAFFFSVDPERDTVEFMHNYTSAFTDRITGIIGDPAEIAKVIKGWRVYAMKVPTDDGDYTMDHTASVFLMDSHADFQGTISYGEDTDVAIQKIRNLLKTE